MKLPVIKIKADNEDGFMIINEKDFDKELHELYKKEKKKVDRKAPKKRIKKEDK